jgi:DNA-binding winged helix-turn-helix (wHTH) protein/tetratricopeptide (TPR) repeat protein
MTDNPDAPRAPHEPAGSRVERSERVDLAHAPRFRLGRLTICPAVRELGHDDGRREILQHRVMQVLVALARADGAIVTRHELTQSCWDGRVVGEDAINRILSRLRAVGNGIGAGSFRIQTITRVGYRLIVDDRHHVDPGHAALPAAPTPSADRHPSRRFVLAAGGAAALGALGTVAWQSWRRGLTNEATRAGVQPMMQQALAALSQGTPWRQDQAISLYQRIVAMVPDYADGWGALGNAYALAARYRSFAESRIYRDWARSAAHRALTLDPGNSFGQVALATARPAIGNWLAAERALGGAIAEHDRNVPLLFALAGTLSAVGRNAEALPLVERMDSLAPRLPPLLCFHIRTLWCLNRITETERLIDETASHVPNFLEGWFTRFYVLLYSGRVDAAIALAENRRRRPAGVPDGEFESILRVARAIDSRNAAGIDSVISEQAGRARQGTGYAENAIQFACALGRPDEAFDIAYAYYFGRGFAIPDLRFTPELASYSPRRDRQTALLFRPVTRPMRADPRFGTLVSELGLERYWLRSGARPDYQAVAPPGPTAKPRIS